MKKSWLIRGAFLALALMFVATIAGCASPDADNASVRPWNAPKNWETGLPSMMTEGR